MSRKDRARQVALEAGAPVLATVEGKDPSAMLARVGKEIGFPALVKAVAGGGGKGMRVAAGPEELAEALATAGREALAAFGDASLLVERYLPGGRHLEVQIVGDGSGKVVHLFDRDCSVQRRHQKVVEEAPASVNSAPARARAVDAALRIAARVSYRSLGTVEFLALGDEVYFLEMNTRLQVEHPVTEAVTGIDVVELQLRLAGGEPLALSQDDVSVEGHAIEVRVYAEDPEQRFPAPGRPGAPRALARQRPGRCGTGGGPGGRHLLRPDAGQVGRPRPRPRAGAAENGRRPRQHGHPRCDDQPWLPSPPACLGPVRTSRHPHELARQTRRRARGRRRSGLAGRGGALPRRKRPPALGK